MLQVHLATHGDPASLTPEVRAGHDPFLDAMTARCAGLAALTRGPVDAMPASCEVLVGSEITAEMLAARSTLRHLIVPWAGIPAGLEATLAASGRRDVTIHNLHHNAASAAETGVGLLLAAARGIARLDPLLRTDDWRPRYEPRPARRLEGGRAAVLGRGAIGGRVARALEGLGMTVDRIGRPPAGGRWAASDLVARLDGRQVLVVAIPLGPETEGVVDGAVLDALVDGIVVNVGRARLIDQDALFDRLADGRLFAAGLDVWWRVPTTVEHRADWPPADRPFRDLDNVVMTPHVGGGLGEPEIEIHRAEALVEVLRRLDG
ncbi:MAG: hypothetical protein CMJ27_08890 [Phycisphaerae bacterium]|nr:hypothetical protein [Phycisphaerae bacterium]OUX01159.1 MAG: hypothetical protein CBD91_05135 [Phycisphaeraceae bacterium TMED231]